jgi:hypothetical protein
VHGEHELAQVTKLESRIADLTAGVAEKELRLKRAVEHLQETTLETARLMSGRLAADRLQYSAAMAEMEAAEPGVLEEINALAKRMGNTGPIDVGAEAEVVEKGFLVRVRVERMLSSDDEYEVTF